MIKYIAILFIFTAYVTTIALCKTAKEGDKLIPEEDKKDEKTI